MDVSLLSLHYSLRDFRCLSFCHRNIAIFSLVKETSHVGFFCNLSLLMSASLELSQWHPMLLGVGNSTHARNPQLSTPIRSLNLLYVILNIGFIPFTTLNLTL